MPIFFIILITVYLGGNTYIFYRGMQALSGLPCGIKIFIGRIILARDFIHRRNYANPQY
jgi:hypothetical protein